VGRDVSLWPWPGLKHAHFYHIARYKCNYVTYTQLDFNLCSCNCVLFLPFQLCVIIFVRKNRNF